jgi:predicted nucleic-acid-binding Zn-ribbon protein
MYVTPSFLSIFSATQIQLVPPSKNYCHLGGQKEIISVGTGEKKTFSIQNKKNIILCNRVARFSLMQNTKMEKNIPNDHKIYQMTTKYTK